MDQQTKQNLEGTTAIGWAISSTGETVNYASFVNTLIKPLAYAEDLNHMAMGVAGESGELVDAIKKHTIYGKDLDVANLCEEIGDTLFYLQRLMFVAGLSLNAVLDANVRKLEKRYHEKKYSNEQAQQRADKNDQA